MSAVTICSIETIENLETLVSDFVRLAPDSPFLNTAWLVPWCSHYLRAHDRIFAFVVTRSEQVISIAPFCLQHSPLRGRTIRFLGSGVVCSDYMTLPTDPDYVEQAINSIADELIDRQDQWDRIELDGLAESFSWLIFRDAGHQETVLAIVVALSATVLFNLGTELLNSLRKARAASIMHFASSVRITILGMGWILAGGNVTGLILVYAGTTLLACIPSLVVLVPNWPRLSSSDERFCNRKFLARVAPYALSL